MRDVEIIAAPGKQEIMFKRVFDAPRELVFKAFTDPQLLPKWLGPRKLTMTVVESDATQGGIWRFVHRAADGTEFAFRGVYHDVAAPERIVRTFEFGGTPGRVSLETVTFDELHGKTTLQGKCVYQTVDDRDGRIASGMKEGLRESMDRLDDLLQELGGRRAG
jgi:uncharacterized protein YndB with AHSA1/START domain